MKMGRIKIGGFLTAVLKSILFMAGVIVLTWVLVWRIMEISSKRPGDSVHRGSLESLFLAEDGFYEIKTAEDFRSFWEGAVQEDCTAKGRLLTDICLNNPSELGTWSEKAPEYISGTVEEFYGIFDGGGHTVYGLYSKNGYGLVKYNRGIIRNLTIENSLVRGAIYSSGICYQNSLRASIYNCHYYGNVVSSYASIPVRMSGICILNEGTIEKCGYAGQMSLKSSQTNVCDRAGICLRNQGVVEDCYNFSQAGSNASPESLALAIADKGEKNCYMLRSSGWESSGEGQVLALDDRQGPYLEDYLDRDLTALLERNRLPDVIRLHGALEDKTVSGLVFDILQQKGGEIESFSFQEEEKKGAQFGLSLNYGEESFLLYAYPYEGKHGIEELWKTGGEILFEGRDADWKHDTFVLLPEKEVREQEEQLLLYRVKGGQWGFFYADGETLYQFVPSGKEPEQGPEQMRDYLGSICPKEDSSGKDTESGREPAAAEESLFCLAFRSVCGGKIPWDGISWKDEVVKSAIYSKLAGDGENLFSAEQVRALDSLEIPDGSGVQTLMDLGVFDCLTGLYVEGFEGTDIEKELEVLPLSELTRLSLFHCGIEDISFLKKMPHLTELCLAWNEITDISLLKGLSELKQLNLTGNQVSDLRPLSGLTSLKGIGLARNQITDITPLKELVEVENLSISLNEVRDIGALRDMKEMEYLGLSGNRIEDFSPVFGMERLFYLEVFGNPSQEIGELYLVPELTIGTRALENERNMELEWAGRLLNRVESGQGLEAEDLVWGDINGDGLLDVAITGYSGEEKDEEGRVVKRGERKVYLFLETDREDYRPAGAVETLGPDQGGIFGDPYMGTAISGGRLVVQCYGGSNFRWTDTRVYEYGKEGLTQLYQLSLDHYVFTSGRDWQVEDLKAGTLRKYAFVGDWESHKEKLLLLESAGADGQGQELEKASWAADALPPEYPQIEEWIYRPEINESYYTYEIPDPQFSTKEKPAEVLEKAARSYLTDLMEFSIPIYSSKEIKNSFDRLAGVELPDCFYSGKGQTGESSGVDVELLSYDRCFLGEDGSYVHVMRIYRTDEERAGWRMSASLFYEEGTETFETADW